jgi:hypothetical protein
MNTFWLKIAGIFVVVVIIFVLITMFTSNNSSESNKPEQHQRTFDEQVQIDKKKFSELPQPVNTPEQNQTTVNTPDQNQAAVNTPALQPVQPVSQTPKSTEPMVLYFKPLSEIDEIEAERLLNVAVPGRSIGRLPMTGAKLMVDTCRQIIQRWPDSRYAYNAKKMLADLPERYQRTYNITPEELDVSMYAKPRPGTQPYTIKEDR